MNKVKHFCNLFFTQGKWMDKEVTYSQRQPNCTYLCNERGEPTATYIWSWVWEITGGKGQVFKKIADHFRGIDEIFLELIKIESSSQHVTWLHLESLGFWPIMPKKLSGHRTNVQSPVRPKHVVFIYIYNTTFLPRWPWFGVLGKALKWAPGGNTFQSAGAN